ncbi:shikimate kinase [Bradyrhizobium pachyrhizi]|uniref:shikimate kinase n=1 Tax=Bradyrhizobium pachyrhizi TaxID=280333 RepID=UPI001FCF82BC|nr:shikimate kinase [Bradyrhizobium pachyrhizi]
MSINRGSACSSGQPDSPAASARPEAHGALRDDKGESWCPRRATDRARRHEGSREIQSWPRALARRLESRFIDSDKQIEAKTGKSTIRIFAEDREAHFRNLEANEIKRALEQGPPYSGGGAFMIDDVRHHSGRKAISIWLNTNEDVIRPNLKHNINCPKLRTSDQDRIISDLLQAHNSIYRLTYLTIAPQHRRDLKSADACMTALHAYLCDTGQGTGQAGLFQELPDAPGSQNAEPRV